MASKLMYPQMNPTLNSLKRKLIYHVTKLRFIVVTISES